MSNLKYAVVEDEFDTTVDSDRHFGKPYVVEPTDRDATRLTHRVEAALDKEFANGCMPA
ncbi:MAG TPA: hypothetical protein VFB24_01685 [Candidatus Binatia bacterium]|nr:hypothetical protein [Candidatus Binatia bacterium]